MNGFSIFTVSTYIIFASDLDFAYAQDMTITFTTPESMIIKHDIKYIPHRNFYKSSGNFHT